MSDKFNSKFRVITKKILGPNLSVVLKYIGINDEDETSGKIILNNISKESFDFFEFDKKFNIEFSRVEKGS